MGCRNASDASVPRCRRGGALAIECFGRAVRKVRATAAAVFNVLQKMKTADPKAGGAKIVT